MLSPRVAPPPSRVACARWGRLPWSPVVSRVDFGTLSLRSCLCPGYPLCGSGTFVISNRGALARLLRVLLVSPWVPRVPLPRPVSLVWLVACVAVPWSRLVPGRPPVAPAPRRFPVLGLMFPRAVGFCQSVDCSCHRRTSRAPLSRLGVTEGARVLSVVACACVRGSPSGVRHVLAPSPRCLCYVYLAE